MQDQPASSERCALCGRVLGLRIEYHHVVPKSRGGRETVPVHPICHRAIHGTLSNAELATSHAGMDAVRADPAMARFLDWVADKPPDFHAPTRQRH
ncbi:HNH endonuclease [Stakelama sp. CBK3Z-3]|uniref:HNH endonuclease n=1 Tax=Stakelama flava TaxID=2860338 RepID=A0ABS6XIH6_9SPHN|nr:HNH endonuclease [Stakelama flava]MBW4329995.1 HNH endonuclease [Stakelama flava]